MGILPELPRERRDRGVDHIVDQVGRLRDFRARHPEVLITSPAQTGGLVFIATWLVPGDDPDAEGAQQEMRHSDLRTLLDCLERQFGEA